MTRNILLGITTFIGASAFLLISCSNTTQKKKITEVELNWKLSNNDTIFYKTVMNEIGESSFDMDFGGVFDKMNDSTNSGFKDFGKNFFKDIKDQWNNTNLITKVYNSSNFEDVIEIEMIAEQKEKDEDDTEDSNGFMSSMMKGTMLRGSFYKSGELHSFWVKSTQKNLLSLFFELPNGSIKVGDSWTLDNVNFIGNDQNFVCQEADKKNTITLTKVEEINGDTIATVEYNILEYVLGDFNTPAFFGNSGKSTETEMKFIYKAEAQFSIQEGKWISYNGIMSLDSRGALKSVQRQKFALIEEKSR